MKGSFILVVAFVTVFSAGVWAQTPDAGKKTAASGQKEDAMISVLPHYLAIQSALAGDTMDGVSVAAAQIARRTAGELRKAALQVQNAKTLADARKAFKALSVQVVAWVEATHPVDVEVVECSMAGARWAQKAGGIANPYYGRSMLSCGERI